MQTSQVEARRQMDEVTLVLASKCPKAAELLRAMAEDVLAYESFPPEHWREIRSTNPLERLP